MKRFLLAALFLPTVVIFSCKTGGGDPKAVLSQFFEALSKKDIGTARKLATEDSKFIIDLMENGLKMEKDLKKIEMFNKSRIEFGETKIEGNMAIIPVKEKLSQQTMDYTLKKEKGGWKVSLDPASLMSSFIKKMEEKGINPMDSMHDSMKELKNINMDSLKNEMREEMKAWDSVNKN